MVDESDRQARILEARLVGTRLATQPKTIRGQDRVGRIDHRGLRIDQRFIRVDRQIPLCTFEIALSEQQFLLCVALVDFAALN